uniref:Fructose-bisphosphate aldolase n=1 Tax=Cannabis sativa TaxID=3483 RepID=A0A803Q9N4_CANSA
MVLRDDVAEGSSSPQESDEKNEALSLEDIAWVDSCLIKESEVSDGNLNSVTDALLEILSSNPGLYNSASVSDECPQEKDVEMVNSTETAEDGQFSGTRAENEDESPKHVISLLSITEEAGSSSDISPIRDPNDLQSLSFVGNPFLPTYIEGSSATKTIELETDPSYSVDEIEPLTDDIFKVWDLSIPSEENVLDKQLNKILEESDPQFKPSTLNDSDIQKDLKEVSLEDVIAAIAASLLKSAPVLDKSEWVKGQNLRQPSVSVVRCLPTASSALTVRASSYADELVKTAKTVASPGRGILAMDESNATCGKRLASIGLENTEANRQAYRTLLVSATGLGKYISGAILFEETLYQSTVDGKKMVDVLKEQDIVPGIKVDKGLVPLAGSNDESWCQGLDGLASRTAAYYQQGARFAKWRTVVSIPNGPSALAVKEAAWGLARYAAISQDNGLVPIVEPEILLDGEHGIDRTFEVAQKVWAEVFYYLAENNVFFEGILLKPSMVTPGAECKDRATPEQVADYTLKLLHRRIPPAVPGIMASGQSEVEATLNLNAMNQSPNPWHVSFSYARALQNTCLKTWGGRPENVKAAQEALLIRANANSLAQLGKYTGEGESEEAKKGMFVKGYVY